jgi:hypothetical protein
MIKIQIPNNNTNERKYIIDILFNEFLGLKYKIETGTKDYEIVLKNGKKLIIEDHFFNKFPNDLEYLKLKTIPAHVEFVKNQFTPENDMPVIFGNTTFNIQHSTLTCGIDIFASSFFMLTRWEEYVNKNRDTHNRFPAYESLAFKHDFLDRPVVNEYVEMLKNMLLALDADIEFKPHTYRLMLSHDVDFPLKYPNLTSNIKEIAGDIIKRKDLRLALDNLSQKLKVHFLHGQDPFDTFDYLMDLSERAGVKSYFFFMGEGITKFDNMYESGDDFTKNLIIKIKKRGHFIGIHPTYNAYNDEAQFRKEKNELEKNLDTKITFGREHYLRFEVPTTWQIWEDNGMKWDSTLSFADKEGFRCGVCYAYSVFNILTRKQLNLKERPLIVMEGSFTTYQPDINPTDMENKIKYLIDKVKKYNGDFVFLWHNSSFNTNVWKKYQNIYERVLRR